MAITDAFRNAVSVGDVRGIRIMMKDSLLVDLSFNEFDEMSSLAQNISGLYDTHNGRGINEDKTTWDDDYMNTLRVDVIYNFSKERLDHLKKVVRHLRPFPVQPQQSASASRPKPRQMPPTAATQPRRNNYQEQKHQDKKSGRITSYRSAKIATGAVAGGVVGGAVAGVASVPVLAGVTVGAAAAGAVVAVVTKGE